MNKIALGRKIDKCLITTDLNYLTNFDLKLFFRLVPKLRHYTGPKNWRIMGTWRNMGWRNMGVTTVQQKLRKTLFLSEKILLWVENFIFLRTLLKWRSRLFTYPPTQRKLRGAFARVFRLSLIFENLDRSLRLSLPKVCQLRLTFSARFVCSLLIRFPQIKIRVEKLSRKGSALELKCRKLNSHGHKCYHHKNIKFFRLSDKKFVMFTCLVIEFQSSVEICDNLKNNNARKNPNLFLLSQ